MRPVSFRVAITVLFIAWSGDSGMPETDPDPIPEHEGWTLVWNDEFDGSALDDLTWQHWVTGNPYNNELQYYTNSLDNSFVEDGKLHIVAQKESYTGPDGRRDYTSARVNTRGAGEWRYGRFEIRAKMPMGQGMWPAIWMMPADSRYGGWPRSGEIDIMEYLGHEPSKVYGTLHYSRLSGGHASSGSFFNRAGSTFADDFHVFALEWEKGEMRWYMDDILFLTLDDWQTEGNAFPAPFDQKFYMILNVAVGGDWPGSPDDSTVFPQEMVVDYVRIFEPAE